MNLLIGNWIIKLVGKISKNDIDRVISRNAAVIAVGEDSYWEEVFLLFVNSTNGVSQFCIVLYSETNVIPYIVCHDSKERLIIGYNHKLAVIDLISTKIIMEKELDGIFCYAKHIDDILIVLSEIGIFILDSEYRELLNQPTDIIESFEFSGNLLLCKTYSGTHTINISKYKNTTD